MFAVEMTGITKRFGENIIANDSVDLKIRKGEVHAIVGENGAGKSTLMKILYGMLQPDDGLIKISGSEVLFSTPAEAIKNKIGMVHQHFMLVKPLTIFENIILGSESVKVFGVIDKDLCRRKIDSLSERFGIGVSLDVTAEKIPVGIQQRIEIFKLLYRDAEILILDEPTAVLTPDETESLFKSIRKLQSDGRTIIIISHKLDEVISVSDNVTVMRNGKVVGEKITSETNKEELSELIIGEKLNRVTVTDKTYDENVILKIENLCAKNDKGIQSVNDVSFDIHKGEVFGIAGVEGNGQNELVDCICGLRKISSGRIELKDDSDSIGHIPSDRLRDGVVLDFSLSENILLGRQYEEIFNNRFSLKKNFLSNYTRELISDYKIKAESSCQSIRELSGGNQQKLVAARELSKNSNLLIVCHPTRGLDIHSTEFVHEILIEEKRKGKAILLLSSDLNELVKLSDRIAVMFNGSINKIFESVEFDERTIGKFMTGALK